MWYGQIMAKAHSTVEAAEGPTPVTPARDDLNDIRGQLAAVHDWLVDLHQRMVINHSIAAASVTSADSDVQRAIRLLEPQCKSPVN